MHSMSGLVLDVYDDLGGEVLRGLYPTFADIPDQVKQAHVLTGTDQQALPDDVFALVLVNNGERLRKFACVDPGGTLLSMQYFLKNAHKLPVDAQKTTAENLKVACSWYDLEVPEAIEKIAISLGTLGQVAMAAPVAIGTAHAIKENTAANKAMGNGQVITPAERRSFLASKLGEASGTVLMPNQPPGTLGTAPKSLTTISKTASAREMRPLVDVSQKEASAPPVEKKAARYALPAEARYPLDSYAQVKAASAYFDTYVQHLPPATRRDYAVNMVKRANELAVPVSDLAQKYGSDNFAPGDEVKLAFDARRSEVRHDEHLLALLGDVEKIARYRMWKEASADGGQSFTPEQVVRVLAEFDKLAGIDHHYDHTIPDPFFSIYGVEKTASETEFSAVIGNDMVTASGLQRFARVGAEAIRMTFGKNFQEEFLEDPVSIFKSLPLDQKKMIMRMANGTQSGELLL